MPSRSIGMAFPLNENLATPGRYRKRGRLPVLMNAKIIYEVSIFKLSRLPFSVYTPANLHHHISTLHFEKCAAIRQLADRGIKQFYQKTN